MIVLRSLVSRSHRTLLVVDLSAALLSHYVADLLGDSVALSLHLGLTLLLVDGVCHSLALLLLSSRTLLLEFNRAFPDRK